MNRMRAYRPGRCAVCGKFEDHSIHNSAAPLKWWQKLARLAWPRWMWQRAPGDGRVTTHPYQPDSRDRAIAASDTMSTLRRRIGRK